MEKTEKIDKIVKEMNELLKEKKMLEEIKNQRELLKKKEMLEEIKMKKLFNTDNVSINLFKKYEFDIPYFIRNVEYEDITTLREKKKYLRKCKEFALLNNVPIILVVNFLLLYLRRNMKNKKIN